jgi:hypothetical protein
MGISVAVGVAGSAVGSGVVLVPAQPVIKMIDRNIRAMEMFILFIRSIIHEFK